MHLHVTTMNLLHCSPAGSVEGGRRATNRRTGRKRNDRLDSCRPLGDHGVSGIARRVRRGGDHRPRGWRGALLGAAGGLAVLGALVVGLGPALAVIPLTVLQLVVGLLLLLFGLSWLRKAVLRAAGIIPLHDERRAFEGATAALAGTAEATATRWDPVALVTTFKAVVLEGLEVVFIVLAVGAAGHMIVPASLGAVGAAIVVALAAMALRGPLTRVPENTLKLSVGVLIGSFGAFWIGEGLGFHWPGADLAVLGLAVAFLAASLLATAVLRRARGNGAADRPAMSEPRVSMQRTDVHEAEIRGGGA